MALIQFPMKRNGFQFLAGEVDASANRAITHQETLLLGEPKRLRLDWPERFAIMIAAKASEGGRLRDSDKSEWRPALRIVQVTVPVDADDVASSGNSVELAMVL